MIRTAECITPKHPDKICDRISDAVLDECLRQDPNSRVAVETCGGHGKVFVTGEVTTNADLDIPSIVERVNGEKIDSVKYENKILTIPYTAQTEKIEVYGSYVIPEFGTIAIIILAVAVVSTIILSRKNSISYSSSNF